MATVPSWLKDKLFLLWYIILYLIIELATLGGIFILSIGVSHWSAQLVFLACRYKLSDVNQTYILVYSVGVLSAQVPKSWRFSLTPSTLHEFQLKRHPIVFGSLRVLLICLCFVLALICQFITFTNKIDNKLSSNELYLNDILFISSLSLLTFNLARVLQSYRKYNLIHCQKLAGPGALRFPGCLIYLIYYCALVILELIYATPLFLSMSAIAFLADRLASTQALTFFLPLATGILCGYLCGAFEENCIDLDRRRYRTEPYFSTIHWDARLNVTVFTLVPLVSRWYFYDDRSDITEDSHLKVILFCGCISTLALTTTKSQMIFSYVVTKQLSSQCSNLVRMRSRNSNRVWPQPDSTSQDSTLPLAEASHPLKSKLFHQFPLDLNNLFKQGPTQDQTSISTGTCTSLINRMNNNDPRQGPRSVPGSRTSSMKTCPRSSQGSFSIDCENGNVRQIARAIPKQQVFVVNRLEIVRQAVPTTTFGLQTITHLNSEMEQPRRSDNQCDESLRKTSSTLIKLKRCPSNLPIVQEDA